MSTHTPNRFDAYSPAFLADSGRRRQARRGRRARRAENMAVAPVSAPQRPARSIVEGWETLLDTVSGGTLGRRALAVGFLIGTLLGGSTPAMAQNKSASTTAPAATVAMLDMAMLKPAATVTGAQIHLGDLFSGCGAHAADVVGDAPPPGSDMIFNTAWLTDTASEHGLSWQPPNDTVSITVSRAASVIDSTEVGQQLLERLAGGRPDRQIQLDGSIRLYVPVGSATDIAIDNLDYDQTSGRFAADLRVPADDPTAVPHRVSGRIIAILDVPTLARPLMPGDRIRPDDISWTKMASQELPPGDITDSRNLVGFTARRPLRAGEPLRSTDVEQPLLVRRNDMVLIVLQQPGLYITAEGKAMEDGAGGQMVSVMNLQSRRIIQTVVTGSDQVGLPMGGPGGQLLAAAE